MAQLPDWVNAQMRKRTIRAPVNPADKSTVVSIYPREVISMNPTIQPGKFIIKPGRYDTPTLLSVGPSSWWREIDEQQPLLEIPHGSTQVADSIVRDWCQGILCCDMGDNMPGLFWIPGNITLEMLKKEYQVLLDEANTKQRNWYSQLVRMGDILWARSNGNPIAISDQMRMAAEELQMKDKLWMKDFATMELKNCPACGVLRNSHFPVCQHCHHIVDKAAYDALGLQKLA